MHPVRRTVADTTRRLVHRFYDQFWNGRDYGAAERLMAPSGVMHGTLGSSRKGPDGLVDYAQRMIDAFPDFQSRIDELIVERDRAAARVSWSGTHRGEVFGCPGTGRRVRHECVVLFHIARGRITEVDVYGDRARLWHQVAAAESDRRIGTDG